MDTDNESFSANTEAMKKILLAVSGLSPQIVTESLYALAFCRDVPLIPDAVHLLTTREGAERARLLLLSRQPGWFHRLRREYNLPPIAFDNDHIHVIRDRAGRAMEDIRTPEDNAAAADCITHRVRDLTRDADSMLHVSIAGGRKTMGFYLGYALSLFGRSQDEMSHVLVSHPYESLRDFFYPSKAKRIAFTHEDKPLDASKAEVWLANIPFVRMRHGIPEALRQGDASFSEVVAAASRAFLEPSLRIDVKSGQLMTPISEVHLPPADLAFYLWMARLRLDGNGAIPCPADGCPHQEYGKLFFDNYRMIANNGFRGHDRTGESLRDGMSKAYFEQRKSLVNKAIRLGLGINASPYEVVRTGRPGHYRFGLLKLEPSQIRVE